MASRMADAQHEIKTMDQVGTFHFFGSMGVGSPSVVNSSSDIVIWFPAMIIYYFFNPYLHP